ncbi:alpha/beta hydrolase [Chengkuizengella axinellae]|uniref:Alpha/beta fold hydrolase n=1 Tax=Chengkuizengella axinellae TaxID=3064388 RepID=A0ABT9IVC5_9BACL|nr:alpha/beta fold hydrolase [Chengkuizengella sp. 2205SS18-9]MDP5273288.1 alpha/beta fold hydrolase [Chengkuizengella sp. 2205SS18-9]
MMKVVGIVLFLMIGLIGFICLFIAINVGWKLSHPKKQHVTDSPHRHHFDYEDVEFLSRDKTTKLRGWYLPTTKEQEKMTIIFIHGYTKNREQDNFPFLTLAHSLVGAGYNVLLFDMRNSGESSGSLTTLGQCEKEDVLGAVDWVKQHSNTKIGLLGVSMGASTAIQAAAAEPSIIALVADSPYHDLKEYLQSNLSKWSNLPNFLFTPLIMNILGPVTGIKPEKVTPIKSVDAVYPRPILFIHSIRDESVPYKGSEAMYNKHRDRFEFWKTTSEGHVLSYQEDPIKYTQKVISFFSNI